MIIPFFDPATIGTLGSAVGAAGSLFGGGRARQQQFEQQRQLQERNIAARQQEQAQQRVQRAGETGLAVEGDASRQRVEALDRVIAAFRQNLRVR